VTNEKMLADGNQTLPSRTWLVTVSALYLDSAVFMQAIRKLRVRDSNANSLVAHMNVSPTQAGGASQNVKTSNALQTITGIVASYRGRGGANTTESSIRRGN
jgi:hypothetical protein